MTTQLCCILLIGATLPIEAAFPGYLPRVGPSPLRFLLPAPVLAQASLPPLAMSDPEPAAPDTNSPPLVISPPPETTQPAPPEKTAEPAPEPNPPTAALPDFSIPGLSQSPLLTPRSLLHYFLPAQNGTNSPTYVIPMGFAPPLPSPPSSSSSTYNSPAGPTPSSISTKP